MEDQEFVHRIRQKIERLTGRHIQLEIDQEEASQLQVELDREVPLVVMGNHIFQYSGFARICIEYAVASIQQQRPINMLEFHLILARN